MKVKLKFKLTQNLHIGSTYYVIYNEKIKIAYIRYYKKVISKNVKNVKFWREKGDNSNEKLTAANWKSYNRAKEYIRQDMENRQVKHKQIHFKIGSGTPMGVYPGAAGYVLLSTKSSFL